MPNKKSLIIIGAGMTGLSAGLTWALNHDPRQMPVCLLEKERIPGGSVTTFLRRGYAFDTCQMISNLAPVFDYFGLKLEFREFKQNIARIFLADPLTQSAKIINLPAGEEAFKAQVQSAYPESAAVFGRFFDYSRAMFREMYALKYAPTGWELVKTLFTCPRIVRHAGRTFTEYLDTFGILPAEIREILRVFVLMAGWPENKVAALLPLGVMFSLLEKAFRPRLHFNELPRQMEKRYLELGGELRLKSEVEKILVAQGRAVGVRLAGGEVLEADHVISTVDVKLALRQLIGPEVMRACDPAYAQKTETLAMTPSSFIVHLGLDPSLDLAGQGFDCGYNLLTTGKDTSAKLFVACEQGHWAFTEECFNVGVICPQLEPADKPTMTLSVFPVPMGSWQEWRDHDPQRYAREKQIHGDFFMDLVERYMLPGLRKHVRVQDISTPATLARYSGSPTGSVYDMASGPDNFGLKRLRMATPIRELYQPKFAHGVFGTIMGGMQAVDMITHGKILHGNSRFYPKQKSRTIRTG